MKKNWPIPCGMDHQYRDDEVIWFSNRRLSCGPRVCTPDARHLKKRKTSLRMVRGNPMRFAGVGWRRCPF